eukprot:CAMPEP_0204371716 /NCGR_PEP_ID=MMETSP0469-20131031/46695_1 /ASSEMBLY_ACC=CAM_ASM_000384 /TAXON_ID=2969 /ORGANISM="Oxyrrhis marina" /LENGTH=132 /DNA_ID=CAMNT_0051361863 /DNA_START=44 /DNA_END=442 /DNA_ORIENTATION=-
MCPITAVAPALEAQEKVILVFGSSQCSFSSVVDSMMQRCCKGLQVQCRTADVQGSPEMVELAEYYDVVATPTVVFLDSGKETQRIVGAKTGAIKAAFASFTESLEVTDAASEDSSSSGSSTPRIPRAPRTAE